LDALNVAVQNPHMLTIVASAKTQRGSKYG
jgi:hypothetical protein